MYYCDNCANERLWPLNTTKTIHTCEMCNSTTMCNEILTGALPAPGTLPGPRKSEMLENDRPIIDLTRTWYVKPDDVIGGWCIMDIDATPAEAPVVTRADGYRYPVPTVASFLSKEVAEHVVHLHNSQLGTKETA